MSGCREILTLQFGNYANHVGAHFWNVQELSFDYGGEAKSHSVSHDVLYREGSTADGRVTYTPRLLLADLRHALGSFSSSAVLGPPPPDPEEVRRELDGEKIEERREPAIPRNEYLEYINNGLGSSAAAVEAFDFESEVKTWTDYLFPRFHPRTVAVVNEYKRDEGEVPFEIYHMGVETWNKQSFSEPFVDNVRKYCEECDNIQGFQVVLDSNDGFGGLADGCLRHLNDEYANKCILAMPLVPAHFPDDDDPKCANARATTRLVNLLLTYEALWESSSLFVPASCGEKGWRAPGAPRRFYNLRYDPKLSYHSSAVIASAWDTFSMCYRLKRDGALLSDVCSDLSGYGRKMAAASLGLPLYAKEDKDLIEVLDEKDLELFASITPSCKIGAEKLFQHVVVRGIPESKLKRPLNRADRQIKMPAYKCETVKEMFEFYFQCNNYASPTHVTTCPEGLELKMPFPKLFGDSLNVDGFVKQFEDKSIEPERVPVIAGLHNGNFLFDTFESLCREGKRIKINKLHKFVENGLEVDDYGECLNKIMEMQNNYEDNFEL